MARTITRVPNLMGVSRKSGNALEYIVCKSLNDYSICAHNHATTEKLKKLKVDYDFLRSKDNAYDHQDQKVTKLHKIFDHLGIDKHCTYTINHDSKGSAGETADIVLHDMQYGYAVAKFSVKHNNLSMKHQRVNKLWLQTRMSQDDKDEFIKEYKEINDKYYSVWKAQGLRLFRDVDIVEKFALYKELNELTRAWLLKDSEYLRHYIEFVLDYDPLKYILKWCPRSETITTMSLADNMRTLIGDLSKVEIDHEESFLRIHLKPTSVIIRARMHNASSRITPTISLKYDTSVQNSNVIMDNFVI
jgi:hypothetical protein